MTTVGNEVHQPIKGTSNAEPVQGGQAPSCAEDVPLQTADDYAEHAPHKHQLPLILLEDRVQQAFEFGRRQALQLLAQQVLETKRGIDVFFHMPRCLGHALQHDLGHHLLASPDLVPASEEPDQRPGAPEILVGRGAQVPVEHLEQPIGQRACENRTEDVPCVENVV
eukprot:CAMPEP_0117559400 /NCGR_PEP_ID=MMETSP0784-20121206/53345_1 /TAXON_ID=39447 /ORGANISM="" /LENGTH=166 /DNA_ID=CAMNT_0005356785 /DNA_START=18 /DNA_END=519 /DNA_ORIENTATION=-